MNKLTIQAPDGSNVKTLSPMYSITTLLFNFFVPLFRKDWKYFGIMLGSLFVFAMIATLLTMWGFRVPIAIFLSSFLGVKGVYLSIGIGFSIGTIISFSYYLSKKWTKKAKKLLGEGA